VAKTVKNQKQVIAFKVDAELATLLYAMPNRSEFIRAAKMSRLADVCPLCRGTGVAPHDRVGDELSKLVQQHPWLSCLGCGVREPRPCHAPGHCEQDARTALFEKFGTYYCAGCFSELAYCARCGRPLPKGAKGRRHYCDACKS